MYLQRSLTPQQGQKKAVEMLPAFVSLLVLSLVLYTSRNAEYTLPNAPHKFWSVTQSVTRTSLLDVLISIIDTKIVFGETRSINYSKAEVGFAVGASTSPPIPF